MNVCPYHVLPPLIKRDSLLSALYTCQSPGMLTALTEAAASGPNGLYRIPLSGNSLEVSEKNDDQSTHTQLSQKLLPLSMNLVDS